MKFIAYIGAIVFIVSLVLVIRCFKRKDKTNFKRNLIVLIVSFIVTGIAGQYVPTSTTTKSNTKSKSTINTKKETVKEEKPEVKKGTSKPAVKKDTLEQLVSKNFQDGKLIVDTTNNIATIQFKVDYTNENNFVTQMVYHSKLNLEEVYKNDELKKYQIVRLEGMADFTDKYGKTTKDVGMKLTFPQSELQKVESFKNISNEQFILLQGDNTTYLNPVIGKNIKPETRQMVFPSGY
jgi:hypothetical protein